MSTVRTTPFRPAGRPESTVGRARDRVAGFSSADTRPRWAALAATVVGLLLLVAYVHTLNESVRRGEALRERQRAEARLPVLPRDGARADFALARADTPVTLARRSR